MKITKRHVYKAKRLKRYNPQLSNQEIGNRLGISHTSARSILNGKYDYLIKDESANQSVVRLRNYTKDDIIKADKLMAKNPDKTIAEIVAMKQCPVGRDVLAKISIGCYDNYVYGDMSEQETEQLSIDVDNLAKKDDQENQDKTSRGYYIYQTLTTLVIIAVMVLLKFL